MAKNETVVVNKDAWTEITDNDITAATWQIIGANSVRIMGTVGAVAPTDPVDGVLYDPQQGEAGRSLSDLFPGIAANRLYARSTHGDSKVFISHA